jgi:hypothetical protein
MSSTDITCIGALTGMACPWMRRPTSTRRAGVSMLPPDPLRPCPSSSEHDGRYRCTDDCPLCLGKGIVRVAPDGRLGPITRGTLADVIDWLRARVRLPREP